MSKENNPSKQEILAKLQQARTLLDECVAGLEGQTPRHSKKTPARATPSRPTPANLDFDAPERAFMKTHAKDLNGQKKFVLVVAFLAKGKLGADVALKEVEKRWNKMTALMGEFNGFYPTKAKESGWVNTKKHGVYVLRPQWREILGG